ncbi:hypothetical protein LCGC14_3022450, partial [marine sediment metagenome]
ANGYNPIEAPIELTAEELVLKDADLDGCLPNFLIPYIEEWKAKHDEHTREGLDKEGTSRKEGSHQHDEEASSCEEG